MFTAKACIVGLLALLYFACAGTQTHPNQSTNHIDTVTVDIIGYAPNFPFRPNLWVKDGGTWKPVNTQLPPKGMYFLDGKFVSYGMADYIQCRPVPRPLRVVLAEIREEGRKEIESEFTERLGKGTVPVFRSVPLHGDIRFEFVYSSDANCTDTVRYIKEFHR